MNKNSGLHPICGGLMTFVAAFAPDVVFNYGNETTNSRFFSDRVKETAYHEYAHAAHFNGINSAQRDDYWIRNIAYIVQHNGYGNSENQQDIGADRCAVIEGWAGHIGNLYADRVYGLNHSRGGNNFDVIQQNRFLFRLEMDSPLRNNPNWIPYGLILDLVDDNNLNPTGVTDPISDNLRGFTTRRYFQVMIQENPATSPIQIRDRIIANNLFPGAIRTDLTDLFNQYRWR